jgi:hypothetical protein
MIFGLSMRIGLYRVADRELTIDAMKLFERNHPYIELSYREVVGEEFKPSDDVPVLAQNIQTRRFNGRFIK